MRNSFIWRCWDARFSVFSVGQFVDLSSSILSGFLSCQGGPGRLYIIASHLLCAQGYISHLCVTSCSQIPALISKSVISVVSAVSSSADCSGSEFSRFETWGSLSPLCPIQTHSELKHLWLGFILKTYFKTKMDLTINLLLKKCQIVKFPSIRFYFMEVYIVFRAKASHSTIIFVH